MLQNRVIPCLLVKDGKLVKTVKFMNPTYIGDPVNAIKIFNEKEVDELIVVDISEHRATRGPNFELVRRIADECFMPVCYGGGITTIDQVQQILRIGIEKVTINSVLYDDLAFIRDASTQFGSQSIVVSVDVQKTWLGNYQVRFYSGNKTRAIDLVDYLIEIERLGAGEILVNDISRDGTWKGFDLDLLKKVTSSVGIPVIAMGGAGKFDDILDAITIGNVSAVAIGSMAVYQKQGMGVLINFPQKALLDLVNMLPEAHDQR